MKRYTKAEAGHKGGSAKSPKKAAAAAVNGAKGGRPRKVTLIFTDATRIEINPRGLLTLGGDFSAAGYIIHRKEP